MLLLQKRVEINRDKKNEVISHVITYQRWKLIGGAGEYSGKRQMFYGELWKKFKPARQKDPVLFNVAVRDGGCRTLPNLRNVESREYGTTFGLL
jgi:hypothetical protein